MQKLAKDIPLLCVSIVFAVGYVVMIVEDVKPKHAAPLTADTLIVNGRIFIHPPDSVFKWTGPPDTITKRVAKFR